MTPQRSPRKSRQQWQALISQWQSSGQNARQFCSAHGLGFAAFSKWQRRFVEPPSAQNRLPPFVEVSSLLSASASAPSAGHWHIVLSLGNGVELRLSQT